MKISNLQPPTSNLHKESGVTLLLSVLILAGLTLITLAVATFATQELRASRAVSVTEPAIAAAETAGEQGIWAVKRTGTLNDCTTPSTQNLGNNTFVNFCKSYSSATFAIKGGVDSVFLLYNPNPGQINTDIDLSEYPYSSITVTKVSGDYQIDVFVTRLDDSIAGLSPASMSVNTVPQVVNISPLPVDTEARMRVVLRSAGDAVVTVNTDRGMPTFPTLDATACSSKTTLTACNPNSAEVFIRRVQITLPQ